MTVPRLENEVLPSNTGIYKKSKFVDLASLLFSTPDSPFFMITFYIF